MEYHAKTSHRFQNEKKQKGALQNAIGFILVRPLRYYPIRGCAPRKRPRYLGSEQEEFLFFVTKNIFLTIAVYPRDKRLFLKSGWVSIDGPIGYFPTKQFGVDIEARKEVDNFLLESVLREREYIPSIHQKKVNFQNTFYSNPEIWLLGAANVLIANTGTAFYLKMDISWLNTQGYLLMQSSLQWSLALKIKIDISHPE